MFSRILTSALIAGAAAGLVAALLQLVFLQPVLLHAELFEEGILQHFGPAPMSEVAVDLPGFDAQRDLLSVAFSMLIYAGFGLMMVAAMNLAEYTGAVISARTGIIWGVAGFVAVHLAPGFSLPPEVPGVAAADITARQIWWFSTVGAAIVALWLLAFVKSPVAWVVSAVLFLVPHIIGAPMSEIMTGPAPTELGSLYAARAFGVNLTGWVVLGLLAGHFWATSEE